MATYLYRNRPPNVGCQPDSSTSHEVWMPPGRTHPSGGDCHFLGQVEYPAPLTLEQIHHYKLWPVDETERAEMVFWLEGSSGNWLRENYLNQPVERLEEYAKRGDQKAVAALILRKF